MRFGLLANRYGDSLIAFQCGNLILWKIVVHFFLIATLLRGEARDRGVRLFGTGEDEVSREGLVLRRQVVGVRRSFFPFEHGHSWRCDHILLG